MADKDMQNELEQLRAEVAALSAARASKKAAELRHIKTGWCRICGCLGPTDFPVELHSKCRFVSRRHVSGHADPGAIRYANPFSDYRAGSRHGAIYRGQRSRTSIHGQVAESEFVHDHSVPDLLGYDLGHSRHVSLCTHHGSDCDYLRPV